MIVERQSPQTDAWIRIAGPMSAQTATDASVPGSGTVSYRISYVSANGQVGPASPAATVSVQGK